MSAEHVLTMLNEHEVKFVDLRFTDTKGKEQHVPLALPTPYCSGQNLNSSCSMTSVSDLLSPVPTLLSTISKAHGTPPPNTKVVTKVTVRQ